MDHKFVCSMTSLCSLRPAQGLLVGPADDLRTTWWSRVLCVWSCLSFRNRREIVVKSSNALWRLGSKKHFWRTGQQLEVVLLSVWDSNMSRARWPLKTKARSKGVTTSFGWQLPQRIIHYNSIFIKKMLGFDALSTWGGYFWRFLKLVWRAPKKAQGRRCLGPRSTLTGESWCWADGEQLSHRKTPWSAGSLQGSFWFRLIVPFRFFKL